ncbi:M1 family metallopeptidase [Flavobacterium sp. ASW18X]|uniref:M1 family metallopeptidase n=1 Tax=Flavobacterium sp. ASW18X TaxID=2572595 RepID=UPI0010AE4146|nr:M1 family metallopeptidase [Flavobacterium sp. ASW18X]TKD60648.1 M1 family metallopeptidase [Flavobacterium sp. ASW18X]
MKNLFTLAIFLVTLTASAQDVAITEDDFLRGSITPERAWWDLTYYHLDITVNPETKTIKGSNLIRFKTLEEGSMLQVDLQPPLYIEKITYQDQELAYKKKGTNAYHVLFDAPLPKGEEAEIKVYYAGKPRAARRAPWDGGFSWKTDSKGLPFVATSCQGLGASAWWPCKDHMYDEVSSMDISVTVPSNLMDVSNGTLTKVEENGATKTYHWHVDNPINNYGVNVNIGDYVHFDEVYQGEKGPLQLDYYVLRENLEKAKKQFTQTPMMLKAFEHWFGPYPFYEDGFKLVEVPYLGMEHQSSVTYGNNFENGYLGRDLSGSGWGMKFDFIIIHEAGHEWFANNITYKDIADMWVHEGFTAYSESLYLDYHFGTEAANAYVIGTRKNIKNDAPIIGRYNLNKEGSGDMYYKGANMLHTIRQMLNDDAKWRSILRGLNKDFYHQTVTTQQIEKYVADHSGLDLTAFFEQYLRTTDIPVLEYKFNGKKLQYRFTKVVDGFTIPVKFWVGDAPVWATVNTAWQSTKVKGDTVTVDENFYVTPKMVK